MKLRRPVQEWLNRFGEGHDELMFNCPNRDCGEHRVVVKAGSKYSGPVWEWNGSMDSPTFSPSLLVQWYDPNRPGTGLNSVCHSFIKNGRIEFCGDCTHQLKGQKVELENYDG